jgi:hypothetical protein
LSVVVEDVDGGVLDGSTDRDGVADLVGVGHDVATGEGGVFSRAVAVDQRSAVPGGEYRANGVGVEDVAASENGGDRGDGVDVGFGELVEQPSGEPGDGDVGVSK